MDTWWANSEKYSKILTNYVKNNKIHVKKIQKRHFPRIKKKRKTMRWGGGVGYRGGVGWSIGGAGVLPTIGALFLKNIIVKTENNIPSLGT